MVAAREISSGVRGSKGWGGGGIVGWSGVKKCKVMLMLKLLEVLRVNRL